LFSSPARNESQLRPLVGLILEQAQPSLQVIRSRLAHLRAGGPGAGPDPRDDRLYKGDFDTFERYCQVKWQYGRNYVNRLISAAQVFTHLVTICHQKTEHETQVRPLVGLIAEQAQKAWEHAVEKAGGRKVTAQMVKTAVTEKQPPTTRTTRK
jgi:hypothetical protein